MGNLLIQECRLEVVHVVVPEVVEDGGKLDQDVETTACPLE